MSVAAPLVILSGGYGVLLGGEPIGTYDRAFTASDWPRGLLSECLVAVTRALGCSTVTAYCAATTGYAKVFRQARWRDGGLEARLVSPELDGRGGAMVLVPRALGEALTAATAGRLDPSWRSSDGVRVDVSAC